MFSKFRIAILLLANFLGVYFVWKHYPLINNIFQQKFSHISILLGNSNSFKTENVASGSQVILLHEIQELDFLPRDEVIKLRTNAVNEHPDFLEKKYIPHPAVFNEVLDRKPWWGIEGIYYFGPGKKGIQGPSEESRFLLNPFLLVGLVEPNAHITQMQPNKYPNYFPKPLELSLSPNEKLGRVRYDLNAYYSYLEQIRVNNTEFRTLDLVGYNARDLGFNYLQVDEQKSKGISWPKESKTPEEIIQYLHTGGSCGYPGGCNNMSPDQAGMKISLSSLPAKIQIKLWKKKPSMENQTPDYNFVIEIVDKLGRYF